MTGNARDLDPLESHLHFEVLEKNPYENEVGYENYDDPAKYMHINEADMFGQLDLDNVTLDPIETIEEKKDEE